MSRAERRASICLAIVYAIRMWGLFLLLPVFAVHAGALEDGTPMLIGLALGIYGVTQALLQVPFGRASDRFGRKPVITAGLLLLATGSVVAALSTTVVGVIIGRAIQGCGAVAAAVMALATDLSREENRAKVMGIIGVSIGMSVLLAFMLAPLIAAHIGVSGIFWLTAGLALLAIVLVWRVVPDESVVTRTLPSVPAAMRRALTDSHVLAVLSCIFTIHALLMCLFVVLPPMLVERLQLPLGEHYKVYVPVLLASVPVLGVVGRSMRTGRASFRILVGAGLLICCGFVLLSVNGGWWPLILGLWLFFAGFNALEAALPSLISRLAPAGTKGATLGLFSTCQFVGVFFGGVMGGAIRSSHSATAVFLSAAVLMGLWIIYAVRLSAPKLATSVELVTQSMSEREAESLRERLSAYDGVVDVTVLAKAGIAYLSVSDGFDRSQFDRTIFNPTELTGTD